MDFNIIEEKFNSNPSDLDYYQRELLVDSLKDIITSTPAYHVYTNFLDGLGHDNSIEMLRKLPTLTKQEVLENSDDYHHRLNLFMSLF